ncbi:MAG: TIGR00730 family Rossman fold protein [Microthrixaceae bacterium]
MSEPEPVSDPDPDGPPPLLSPPQRPGPAPAPTRSPRPRSGSAEVDAAIKALVEGAGITGNQDLIAEMLGNVVRIGLDTNDRGRVKLLNVALRDLRRAMEKFHPYRHRRKASIFGSARIAADSGEFAAAREMGAALSDAGWMVITGGGPGVMTAGIEGAGGDDAFGVTIRLPFEPMEGGGIVPEERMVRFRHFFSRKLTFMQESSAYVVFPGGFGTLDETFELLTLVQTGKEPPVPIVLFECGDDLYWRRFVDFLGTELIDAGFIATPDVDLFHVTSSVSEAIEYIADFYSVFHSLRWVDGLLVLRLERVLDEAELAALNERFGDIVTSGRIEAIAPTAAEVEDGDELERPRIAPGSTIVSSPGCTNWCARSAGPERRPRRSSLRSPVTVEDRGGLQHRSTGPAEASLVDGIAVAALVDGAPQALHRQIGQLLGDGVETVSQVIELPGHRRSFARRADHGRRRGGRWRRTAADRAVALLVVSGRWSAPPCPPERATTWDSRIPTARPPGCSTWRSSRVRGPAYSGRVARVCSPRTPPTWCRAAPRGRFGGPARPSGGPPPRQGVSPPSSGSTATRPSPAAGPSSATTRRRGSPARSTAPAVS